MMGDKSKEMGEIDLKWVEIILQNTFRLNVTLLTNLVIKALLSHYKSYVKRGFDTKLLSRQIVLTS